MDEEKLNGNVETPAPAPAPEPAPAQEPAAAAAAEPSPKQEGGSAASGDLRDLLLCFISAGVFAALSVVFLCMLASAMGDMSALMRDSELGLSERIIGSAAHLLLAFGLGIGAVVVSFITFPFANQARKRAQGIWRWAALGLMALPGAVVLAIFVMLSVSLGIVF